MCSDNLGLLWIVYKTIGEIQTSAFGGAIDVDGFTVGQLSGDVSSLAENSSTSRADLFNCLAFAHSTTPSGVTHSCLPLDDKGCCVNPRG